MSEDRKKQAVEALRISNLFTDEELDFAEFNMHEYAINPYVLPGITAIGMSPNKVGELIGVDGATLQAKCKNRQIEAYQDFQSWWTIPVTEIIKLKMKQNAKKDKVYN